MKNPELGLQLNAGGAVLEGSITLGHGAPLEVVGHRPCVGGGRGDSFLRLWSVFSILPQCGYRASLSSGYHVFPIYCHRQAVPLWKCKTKEPPFPKRIFYLSNKKSTKAITDKVLKSKNTQSVSWQNEYEGAKSYTERGISERLSTYWSKIRIAKWGLDF